MKLPSMSPLAGLLIAGLALLLPINAFACSTGYFRFVETGTASPFVPSASRAYYDDQDQAGTAISVFVDLTSADALRGAGAHYVVENHLALRDFLADWLA